MTESTYTLPLTNAQRIALRRLVREEAASVANIVCTHALGGNTERAKELAEERQTLLDILESIRTLEPQ